MVIKAPSGPREGEIVLKEITPKGAFFCHHRYKVYNELSYTCTEVSASKVHAISRD